jgi:hypothetical protein
LAVISTTFPEMCRARPYVPLAARLQSVSREKEKEDIHENTSAYWIRIRMRRSGIRGPDPADAHYIARIAHNRLCQRNDDAHRLRRWRRDDG